MKHKTILSTKKRVSRKGWVLAAGSLILSILVIAGLLQVNQKRNEEVFQKLISEILSVSHQQQEFEARNIIETTQRSLEAIAAIYQTSDADPESAWTQSYLKAVQNFNSVRDIRYFSAATLRSMLETPIPGTDPQGIENLLNGQPYISDLFQQKQYGTDALISISVPVIQNDQVIGAFHSILNADLLVNVPNSDDEEYAQNFLVRRDGEIILEPYGWPEIPYHLQTELEGIGASDSTMGNVETALKQGESEMMLIEGADNRALYITISSLGYNDWLLLSIAYPYEFKGYSKLISQNAAVLTASLIVFLVLLAVVVSAIFTRQRRKILHNQARYDLLAQFSDTILFEYTCETQRLTFTPNIAERFNVPADLILYPMNPQGEMPLIHPEDHPAMISMLNSAALSTGNSLYRLDVRFQTREGGYRWVSCQGQAIRERSGYPLSIIGKIVDIQDQKSKEERLIEKSSTDAMTGALNREATEARIEKRLSDDQKGFLFLLDIDNFKEINDTRGHMIGDQILIDLVQLLKSEFRQNDVIGRLGGDEFMVFMNQTQDPQAAIQKASHILNRLAVEKAGAFSVSIGIASAPLDGTTYDQLYDAADKAMYQAKRQGKNSYFLRKPRPEDSSEKPA